VWLGYANFAHNFAINAIKILLLERSVAQNNFMTYQFNPRLFLSALALILAQSAPTIAMALTHKGVMLINRIGPSTSTLYVSGADGTGERKLLQDPSFDYHATISPDGQWVVFTSERNGDGQSDIYRARLDGTGLEKLVDGPSMDDAGALSPDGKTLAFVSTRDGYRANIWTMDIETKKLLNLTGQPGVQGDISCPDCFFRPSWSPDGQWLAFSSDRNTDWRGHDNGRGWEHTQELSIYVIRRDGTGFRRIASNPDHSLGSPKWSPDGKSIVFYELPTEQTWAARRPNEVAGVTGYLVSVDIESGKCRNLTGDLGLKLAPQYLNDGTLAYQHKGGEDEGFAYQSTPQNRPPVSRHMRSPSWTPDGKFVVYEKVDFTPRGQNKPLYSWDIDYDYKHTDVFPALSKNGKLVMTEKAHGSTIVTMNPDESDRHVLYDPKTASIDPQAIAHGMAGAFAPCWSADGEWIAFGVGHWFQDRARGNATIMRMRKDGSGLEALTDGTSNCGFPSLSPDGQSLVYRTWKENDCGLNIMDLNGKRNSHILTRGYDNLPGWSPDGSRIVFTRKVDAVNFDVFTIRPDGTDLLRLTTHRANDGHAVWTADGKIMWSSGFYGFRDEAALYDNTFQPYGQIFIMDADGSNKHILTDSLWEDSMPLYLQKPFN
jgi:Tol biopolymer transport system component